MDEECITLPDTVNCVCVRMLNVSVPVCWSHSALGMMVNGRMGLLASSSSAVRKHSVAAAALP